MEAGAALKREKTKRKSNLRRSDSPNMLGPCLNHSCQVMNWKEKKNTGGKPKLEINVRKQNKKRAQTSPTNLA